jgi:NitT/TauT family transport system ATP-binding protein
MAAPGSTPSSQGALPPAAERADRYGIAPPLSPAGTAFPRSGGTSSGAPIAASPLVRLQGIHHAFGTRGDGLRPVLSEINLDVGPGEIVALVGPNGCGKSTLLRLIAGLARPVAGSVHVADRRVEGPQPAVGIVFQEPRLLPWRTALDNVAYPLELAGVPAAIRRQRARELLRLVGVEGSAHLRPHQLSGGMRQRVALARALARDPAVLLLDEPFSALDALTRDRFNVELLRLWERHRTAVIFVTHDIAEALFVADRVVVLSERPGRIVGIVPSPLPRPRRANDLDHPALAAPAATIRRLLGWPAITDDARREADPPAREDDPDPPPAPPTPDPTVGRPR